MSLEVARPARRGCEVCAGVIGRAHSLARGCRWARPAATVGGGLVGRQAVPCAGRSRLPAELGNRPHASGEVGPHEVG